MGHFDLLRHPPRGRDLLRFGVVLQLAFGAIGAVLAFAFDLRSEGLAAAAAGAVFLAGSLVPPVGRLLWKGWMGLGLALGLVTSPVVLAAVFVLVVVPLGLVYRLLGHDPLRRRLDRGAATYWIDRRPPADPARYLKPY